MIKASVIGWPITHSRSPLIHGYWLKQHGIRGSYEKIAVEPQNLEAFVDSLRTGEHAGSNVTLPHKERALIFVDVADERAQRIGAVNTIWREAGKLHATSTDGQGFVLNVAMTIPGFQWKQACVTILGAGGSARALIDEMLRQGVERVDLYNRTSARAEQLAQHFGPQIHVVNAQTISDALRHTHLLVNTTSAGLQGDLELQIPWPALPADAVVADIVYTPLITAFLQDAKRRGHAIVPGLGMLLHQAVPGFEKWFGVRPEVTEALHDLVARDIDPDYTR
jgi:shikimate dehydrogenase